MGQLMYKEQTTERFGDLWCVTQIYGIDHRVDVIGEPKHRCIDDFADNLNNDAAERSLVVPTSSVAMLMLVVGTSLSASQ